MSLSPRQQDCLTAIRSFRQEHGYPPSVRELCVLMGSRSSSTVHAHLDSLERAGVIHRDPRKARALFILQSS